MYLKGYKSPTTKRRPLKRLHIKYCPENSKTRINGKAQINVSVQVDFTDILESTEHKHHFYSRCECEKLTCLNCTKQKILKKKQNKMVPQAHLTVLRKVVSVATLLSI